jgi:hypothetical protein
MASQNGVELALLQCIFNHSSQAVTLRYIGMTQDEANKVTSTLSIGILDRQRRQRLSRSLSPFLFTVLIQLYEAHSYSSSLLFSQQETRQGGWMGCRV